MIVKLHKNARTTPAIRAQLAASNEPVAVLAKRFNLAPNTVRKWQARTDFNDRSHTAHNLQTTLSSAQEHIVIYLRKHLLLPLDDLLSVTREFLCPEVSRSGLNRCLRRHGVGNLREMTRSQDNKPKYQRFKDYPIGFVHIDIKYLPQMADESKRRYLFVAIDRATRMVCVQLRESKTAKDAREFLKFVTERFPFEIKKVLTDNGKEFTNKVFGYNATNKTHEFDELCLSLGIEHRLTKVRRPQTNGMVERFNGRIADILRTHHFQSGKELEHTIMRYVDLYNNHLPQANLNCRTPCQVMYEWYVNKPQFFDKVVHNRPEGDSYRGAQEVEGARVLIPGSPKYTGGYSESALRSIFRKRAGVEATIGHLKSDFRMGRNYLGGIQGDHFNLLMSCCAHNLKLWVRETIFLFLYSKCLLSLKFHSMREPSSLRPSLLAA